MPSAFVLQYLIDPLATVIATAATRTPFVLSADPALWSTGLDPVYLYPVAVQVRPGDPAELGEDPFVAEPPQVLGVVDEDGARRRRPEDAGAADLTTQDAVDEGRLARTRRATDDGQQRGIDRLETGDDVVVELTKELRAVRLRVGGARQVQRQLRPIDLVAKRLDAREEATGIGSGSGHEGDSMARPIRTHRSSRRAVACCDAAPPTGLEPAPVGRWRGADRSSTGSPRRRASAAPAIRAPHPLRAVGTARGLDSPARDLTTGAARGHLPSCAERTDQGPAPVAARPAYSPKRRRWYPSLTP